jgi:hypothetical protein
MIPEASALIRGAPRGGRESACVQRRGSRCWQSSIKKALDYTWSDPADKAEAVSIVVGRLTSLEAWIRDRLPEKVARPPLKEHVETLHQVMEQDLEPDPTPGGDRSDKTTAVRIREGVAPDRRVSIEDSEMRHGRKSKSKRFNGYKRHLVGCLDSGLILACAITPANRPKRKLQIPSSRTSSISSMTHCRSAASAAAIAIREQQRRDAPPTPAHTPRTGRRPVVDDDGERLDRMSNDAADLIHSGKLNEAEQLCHRLLEDFPDLPDGHMRLGRLLRVRGEPKKAAEHLRLAAAVVRSADDDPVLPLSLETEADSLDPPIY